jgi:hypothetical protein
LRVSEARANLGAARNFEWHARFGQRAFGAHQTLRDGRLLDQERPRDLLGGQTAHQTQRERDPRVSR